MSRYTKAAEAWREVALHANRDETVAEHQERAVAAAVDAYLAEHGEIVGVKTIEWHDSGGGYGEEVLDFEPTRGKTYVVVEVEG